MKKILWLIPFTFCFLFVYGCQESQKRQKESSIYKIPKVMVGIWEARIGDSDDKWAFKIEPDSSIPKLIHPLAGPINVKEGGYENEGPDPNTFEAYIMGPCKSSFDSTSGIFTVHIVLDGFTIKLPQGELTGTSDDYFKGKISEDGKIWKADWFNYGTLEGASPPDVNYVNANPQKLVFHKLDPKKRYEEPNFAEPNGVK
jgi:hypothetical protein